MPAVDVSPWHSTPTHPVFVATSSLAPRQKLKTPMIAGSVCGGVMGIAWIIGFTIYFRKRYKRRKLKRKIEAGRAVGKQKPSKIPEEKIIVPPDPAILLGRLPGEYAFREGDSDDQGRTRSSNYTSDRVSSAPAILVNPIPNETPPFARISEEMAVPPKR